MGEMAAMNWDSTQIGTAYAGKSASLMLGGSTAGPGRDIGIGYEGWTINTLQSAPGSGCRKKEIEMLQKSQWRRLRRGHGIAFGAERHST